MKAIPGVRFALTQAAPPRRGFALVITLTLMILLTILAVGLLSLSSISLRSSGTEQSMNIARANARMALILALGQIQTATGPDKRITATADLAGAAGGDRLSAGQNPVNLTGLNRGSAVLPGTRYWTGVWKNTKPNPTVQNIYNQPHTSAFVQWLISGNEHQSTNALASPALTPNVSDYAVGTNGAVNNATKAVVLVGKNSVGDPSATNTDGYVSAPLVEIKTDGVTGRYAWWAGDEGVKVKINRSSSYTGTTPATYQELSAQRAGWETVDGFSNFPVPGNSRHVQLNKVVTLQESTLIDSNYTNASEGVSPLDLAFHSATTDSMGVIADTMQGGLRLDLTAYLGQPLPGTSLPGLSNSPANNKNLIPSAIAPLIKGPRWNRLKDFSEIEKNLTAGKLMVKQSTSEFDGAIAPVITDLRLLLGAKLSSTGSTTAYKVQACAKIAVGLANPYPYPLEWNGLDVEIINVTPAGNVTPSTAGELCKIWNGAGTVSYVPNNAGQRAVFNKTIFRIPSGTLPPGEAKAYTNNSQVNTTGLGVVANLSEVSSGSVQNFDHCVVLENSGVNNLPFSLDVRENTVTSQINVELRTQGAAASGGAVLRKIEKFELDNGEFETTAKRFAAAADPATSPPTFAAASITKPVPIQLYSFQMSQPGADYRNLFLAPADFGLRSSTLRSFADFNWQATRYRKPIICYNPPPFFMRIATSASSFNTSPPGGSTGPVFSSNLVSSPLRWGSGDPSGSQRTILFSPPQSLVSLAQFQHADLTADNTSASIAHQPGNAVGNSYASPFVPRNFVKQTRTDHTVSNYNATVTANNDYYDISYLLNTALWDTYFLSTIPLSGSMVPLNEQMVNFYPSDTSNDLRNGELAAGRLLINGSFNVNSTNKDAWKALLASSKHLKHKADASGSSTNAMFPRSLEQISTSQTPPTGNDDDSFSGYRRLTDAELDALAVQIVKQVRIRGPFLSLAHFVNRTLVAASNPTNRELGRSGALQAAIDASGATISPDGTKMAFSDINIADEKLNLQGSGSTPNADLSGGKPSSFPSPYSSTSRDGNPGAVAGILAEPNMLTSLKAEQGFRSTGIPGWLTQADVLQVIGPSLSTRSDTFRVRAYGEAVDPKTGVTTARAWCEAIVQRTPDYMDSANAPKDRVTIPVTAPGLTPLNTTFGRRYRPVSFKWLSPDEI